MVRRDAAFYQNSGGGMTLSGGEPLLQPVFARELLKWCREEQIHTAVDTAGNVPYAVFEKIISYTDLFLFDLKAASPELHREGTGVDNRMILELSLIHIWPDSDDVAAADNAVAAGILKSLENRV